MIKNYSLIAQKWADFFDRPEKVQEFLNTASKHLQSVMDAFVGELSDKHLSDFSEKDTEVLESLFFESFVAGVVLGGLENNKNILSLAQNFSQEQGNSFFEVLDSQESFEQRLSQIDIVTDALFSKAASQMLNRVIFVLPEYDQKPYGDLVHIQNHFYFSVVSGYIFTEFL
jgi:hypothetical protein